jgi:DDE superfamily endonuclease
MELVQAAQQAGIGFRAVVADCAYGDNPGVTHALGAAGVRFVLALKPGKGTWAPAEAAQTPTGAAGELGWRNPSSPGRWRRVRRFRDGHTETWWAADAQLGGWGPDRPLRLSVASIDPERLPGHSTWYLLTNLPRPASRRAQPAELADIERLQSQAAATAARGAQATGHPRRTSPQELVAGGVASGAGLADPMQRATAVLAVVVASAAAPAAAAAA